VGPHKAAAARHSDCPQHRQRVCLTNPSRIAGPAMLIEHQSKRPNIHPTADVAPTAVICGDVTIGPHTHVSFGAVIEAHGAPVRIGAQCVVRENLNIRSTSRHAVEIGDHVLIGPQSSLKGCIVEDECFLATGAKIYQGAVIGRQTEVRIDGVVHVRSVLRPRSLVPIKWVAVGDPAQIFPPDKHEQIDATLAGMNFPEEVYGLQRQSGSGVDMDMMEVTRRETSGLADHRNDRELVCCTTDPERVKSTTSR
jgi:carbonic anhydrase/acetyltransferase-like protein (isoleucine patch superfamily)